MKIAINVPTLDGKIHNRTMHALFAGHSLLRKMGHQVAVYTHDGSGGIAKVRNVMANQTLNNKFDRLLFVDADVVFTPQQIEHLFESGAQVIGGVYPYRTFPIRLNFNPLEEDAHFFTDSKSVEAFQNFRKEKGNVVEVKHIPTGFMLIDTEILTAMALKVERYVSFDAIDLKPQILHDFFPMRLKLHKYKTTEFNLYDTEDWAFCEQARKVGAKVYLETRCVLNHIGEQEFSAGLA